MLRILSFFCICSIFVTELKAQNLTKENGEALSSIKLCDLETINKVQIYSKLFQSEFEMISSEVNLWRQTLINEIKDSFRKSQLEIEVKKNFTEEWKGLESKNINILEEHKKSLEKIFLDEKEYLEILMTNMLKVINKAKVINEANIQKVTTRNSLPLEATNSLPEPQRGTIITNSDLMITDLKPYDEHFNCKANCTENLSINCRESKVCNANGLCLLEIPNSDQRPFFIVCYYQNTVIQRRLDGSVNFNRTWLEYKNGFGNLQGEYWIGLDRLHEMTKNGEYGLSVQMTDINGNNHIAMFLRFGVGSENEDYELHLNGYWGGTHTDILQSSGRKFSTFDKDNDSERRNCAAQSGGGWWFSECNLNNLNTIFQDLKFDGLKLNVIYMVITPVL